MKFTFETRFLRLEFEFGYPRLEPKKYEVLPRKSCYRLHDRLMDGISSRLKHQNSHDTRSE